MTDVEEYFGASELVDYQRNQTRDKYQMIFIAIIIVAAILILIWYVARRMKIGGLDHYQRAVQHAYERTGGDQPTDEARQVVEQGQRIPNPTAMDHFRVGVVQLNNMHDVHAAHQNFRQAVQRIEQGQEPREDTLYILGRLHDFEQHFVDDDDLERIDIQRVLLEQIDRPVHAARVQHASVVNKMPRIEILTDDEQKIQKTLLNQQYWTSEPQNVHDNNIAVELKRQYAMIRDATAADQTVAHRTYSDCCRQLEARLKVVIDADQTPANTRYDARECLRKIEMVIGVISNNSPISILGCNEQDFVETVWRRIHQQCNAPAKEAMCTALQDSLADCVEHEHVVCQTGRTEKIWAALAMLDAQPGIGVFKTRQAMLNEISERAARIVDRYIGPESGIRKDVLDDFNGQKNGETAQQIAAQIEREILDMKQEYVGRLDEPFLTVRINECLEVVR